MVLSLFGKCQAGPCDMQRQSAITTDLSIKLKANRNIGLYWEMCSNSTNECDNLTEQIALEF